MTMILPADLPADQWDDAARKECGDRQWCKVFGWTDASFVARAMPMTDREAGALTFSYSLNRATGLDQALWDCRRYRRATNECLATP